MKFFTVIVLLCLTFSASSEIELFKKDVKVGFSPYHNAQNVILHAIKDARFSIDIAAYSFTSKKITLALMDAKKRGVLVRIVADKKSNSSKYTALTYLRNNKILIRLNDQYTIMHNKFMIIDNVSVQTGSFNYTKAADSRNAENVIYLKNIKDVAEKYSVEFNRLWEEANVDAVK